MRTLCVASLLAPLIPAQVALQFQATTPTLFTNLITLHCAIDDFDRDGDPDVLLIVIAFFSQGVRLFTNDGLGNFAAAALPAIGAQQAPIPAFLDFDGDGDDDLFFTWPSSPPTNRALLRYLGGGAWLDASASLPTMPPWGGLVVGDFDGDGDPDIAGCGTSIISGTDSMLVNNAGTFTFMLPIGGQSGSIAAGDVDGDGDLDIVLSTPQLQLWRNNGGLSFTNVSAAQLPPLPVYWAHMVFGDIDGDGDQDLVLGDEVNSLNLIDRLLQNQGNGTFVEVPGAIPGVASHTLSLALVDVDEDGDLDLLRGGGPQPNLCLNGGTGQFTLATSRWPAMPNVWGRAYPADLDRDGDLDVVLAGGGTSPVQLVWNHHRHLTVPAPPAIGQNWTVEVWGQPGYGVGTRAALLAIGLARLPQPLVVPPLGALWLDLGVPFVLQPALIGPAAGAVPLVFAVPAAPQLVGITLHAQALVDETAAGDARLTPLVSATIH